MILMCMTKYPEVWIGMCMYQIQNSVEKSNNCWPGSAHRGAYQIEMHWFRPILLILIMPVQKVWCGCIDCCDRARVCPNIEDIPTTTTTTAWRHCHRDGQIHQWQPNVNYFQIGLNHPGTVNLYINGSLHDTVAYYYYRTIILIISHIYYAPQQQTFELKPVQ